MAKDHHQRRAELAERLFPCCSLCSASLAVIIIPGSHVVDAGLTGKHIPLLEGP
jgi:hypothetical protein